MISNMTIALISVLSIGLVPFITDQESTTIVLVSLGCFGYAFFGYPMISAMVDCVTLRALGDDKALYGRQKIGCPIGVSSAIFLVGLLQETFETQYALFWVYTVYVLGFIATIACTDLTPHRYTIVDQETPLLAESSAAAEGVEKQNKSMWHLFRQPESMHFYTVVAILGFCFSIFQIFLFMFIRNDLHGTPAMIGLLGPLSGFSELLVFFYSKQIFKSMGVRWMLTVAHIIAIYRVIIYILAMDVTWGAWLVTINHLAHGIMFSMIWTAAALQADAVAPLGLKSTAQGLLNVSFNGVGGGTGALVAGYVYENRGVADMWAMLGLVATAGLVIFLLPAAKAPFRWLGSHL
ncbi:major facilitator superfamily domain-containing protein [Phycomyces nitens]|nr:major facilitator superfamily domain-containing protein [Phycomyces nitens]